LRAKAKAAQQQQQQQQQGPEAEDYMNDVEDKEEEGGCTIM
jgi:hypothetical protein